MECFRYLGVYEAAGGTKGADVSHMVEEGTKVLGALRNVWKES